MAARKAMNSLNKNVNTKNVSMGVSDVEYTSNANFGVGTMNES